MEKIVASDREARSADIVTENLEQLKALFPQAFTDGKVDFQVLRQILGDAVDDSEEKYGLNWHGKRRARQLSLTPSTGTLRPCPEDSVDWETTQNLMIEGDNLEVLKLLQKSYAGKVKLIYIDPPYNTGKDFVYRDDYRDNLRNYLELTGQVDGDNRKLSSNAESSGRFHTDWLNMMYPRLLLSRHLLKPDGVLLISIDDTEVHNLRAVCDDVFGSENFCGTFVWEKKKKPSFLDRNMGTVTDYIVAYAKNRSLAPPFVAGSVEEGKKYPFNNAGNPESVLSFPPRSVKFSCPDQQVTAQDMSQGNIVTELLDDVRIEAGSNVDEFRLRGEWRYSQAKLDEFIANGAEIVISKVPFRPNYINRSGEMKKTSNLLSHRVNGIPTNEDATQEMRVLFGMDVMSYPKPSGLVKYLVRSISTNDDIVLDFFAGSGTTANGVLQQNLDDGLARRYFLVQLPEVLDINSKEQQLAASFLKSQGQPNNIAELTKEYLRRIGSDIREKNPMFVGDVGFRAFKLDSTNIRKWEPEPDNLEASLELSIQSLNPDCSKAGVLFELLIRLGLDLCISIDDRIVAGKSIYSVGGGILFACLDMAITVSDAELIGQEIIAWHESLTKAGDVTCVFRDNAFVDDVAKINLTTFLQEGGISSIKSI
ncbi:MAG: site-specific DNA-methyltransferase [Gammaproteobacteria bacterium]|nr:site-specific DNA-methyltransferase [Gammaproteobacteria bacterium]MYD01936.1 site-specific DNA-methyltransferase [Gammaproteobacteria bacterium]MYI25540.1 site-specific DNA-methyltransferase [Gammaproteobacteria bacterium]